MENKKTHMKFGLIAGIIMVVIAALLYVTDLSFKPGLAYLIYLPFLVCIILNAMEFSKLNDHVTFGKLFSSGFKMSAIVTLIYLVWGAISVFVFPEMKEKAIQEMSEQMQQNPNATEEQIDMAISMTSKYWTAMMIGGSIFVNMFWGAIFSLIGAAIAKKKSSPFGASSF